MSKLDLDNEDKKMLNELGLDFFTVSKSINAQNNKVDLALVYCMTFTSNEELSLEVSRFANKIMNSNVVNKKISALRTMISKLEREVVDLKGDVKDLKQYKTHYNMEYHLKHGQVSQL